MSHDYDPSWDYPVVELDAVPGLSPEDKTRVRHAIDTLKTSLACALGFTELEVFFVEPMGLTSAQDMNAGRSAVAVYCNGTSSRPVLGLDLAHMAEICQEESLDLLHQVRLSLAHELAHAYQETLGLDVEHEEGFNEDDAEAFARAWVDNGELQVGRLHQRCEPDLHGSLRPQTETFI